MGTDARGIASQIERGLRRLRTTARFMLIGRGVAIVLAAVIVAMVTVGMLDFVLRFPRGFRVVFLIGLGVFLAWGFVRFVLPGVRFRPPLHEVALRVERSRAGREAGLEGVLASGLEFADSKGQTPIERALAEQVADRSSRLWSPRLVGAMLAPRSAAVAGGMLLAAVFIAVAPVFVWPELVTTAARRVLTPWSSVNWPTRTLVADGTNVQVHPANQALALRAVLTRTNRREGQTRVTAQFRVIDGTKPGQTQTVVLTSQNRVVEVPEVERRGDPTSGELFERLIEPGSLAMGHSADVAASRDEFEVEYWFQSEDSRTEPVRVLVVRPPSVRRASIVVDAPAYARDALAALEPERVTASIVVDPEKDRSGAIAPALKGSRVSLTIEHSKPVPATLQGEVGHSGFLRQALGLESLPDDLRAKLEPERWSFEWTLRDPMVLRVMVVDRHGLRSADEVTLAFDAIDDAAPTAAVTEPAQDEAVLATAVIPATAEARDDIAVASVALDLQVARPPAPSSGVGPEGVGEPRVAAGPLAPESATRTQSTRTVLELASLDLREGDEVWLHAIATDGYALDGASHGAVRSTTRRLRVISEPRLIEQVRAELQSVRQAAIRLDAEQSEITRAGERVPPPRDLAERQAALGERIAAQRETIERLAQRTERNNLRDTALESILGDARSFVEGAAAASQRATEGIQERAAGLERSQESEASEDDPAMQQRIASDQEQVRDELGQLVRLLDNGQDAWVARRSVERLLSEQRRLLQQTLDIASRTTGRDVSALTPDERTELERIADRQQDAADAATGALDELSERSRDLREADAAQSQAMAIATQRGRSSNIAPKLEEAAQQIAQNQANAAARRQQEAIETLEEMLRDLDSAEQRRDQALRRQLASIIESLESLIAQQDVQIALLARARGGGPTAGLDTGMIRLSQNTLGVIDQISAAGRGMEGVGNLVLAASTAQGIAITSLREPLDLESADSAERLSATRLRDAKAEAERLDKEAAERDAGRKRKELRAAYREALEQQIDLLRRSEPLVGRELDRRERAGVRQAGEQQDGLRQTLDELRQKTEELAEVQVFAFAHERMDQDMRSAAESLREARVDRGVVRRQETAARLLQSLLNALADPKDERDFRDQAGGEQGGGGGGQGQGNERMIPDLAKLRLLREMQQYVLEATRAADDDPSSATADEIESMGRLQREIAEQGRALLESMAQPTQSLPTGPEAPETRPIERGPGISGRATGMEGRS
ncbi:MAG: hypothetical protein KF705_06730 [Phycisphaeraceae bacterium]|nr:hypothetical protein [Phycisphaeraceae bacterium]